MARAWVERSVLLGLILLGGWLRLGTLDDGISPDEFANLWHGGLESAWAIAVDPESGVNPPLLRLLFNPLLPEPWTFTLGRLFSWSCGVAAIGLAFVVGRGASGGSSLAGLAAAALVALDPQAVKMSGRFRAYAAWVATMGWQLVALEAWMRARRAEDAEAARRWAPHVVVSALLLPQWHYVAIPVLLALGAFLLAQRPFRRGVLLYVPAAVAVAPLGLIVLGETGARVEHGTPLPRLYALLLSLDLRGLPSLVRTARPWLPEALRPEAEHAVIAVPLGVALLVALLCWRRWNDLGRACLVGAVAVLLTALAFSRVQLVRTPTVLMLLVFAAPLLAALPSRLPWLGRQVWGPPMLLLALGALVGPGLPGDLDATRHEEVYAGLPRFAEEHRRWDAERGDLPVRTWPAYTYVGLYYYLTGRHVRFMDGYGPSGCGPTEDGCFAVDGVRYLAIREGDREAPRGALVAAFGRPPDGFADGCTSLHEERWYRVWRCPAEPVDAAPDASRAP
ncbi:MAG: hypothetical protein H6732_16315 [Alphaproteobacteria bacterium]|nr:hypothetical protein [Alphaproteobacteria bacterium]